MDEDGPQETVAVSMEVMSPLLADLLAVLYEEGVMSPRSIQRVAARWSKTLRTFEGSDALNGYARGVADNLETELELRLPRLRTH